LVLKNLRKKTEKPSKSLHRMLSQNGNPSMDNLAAIFGAVRTRLNVGIEAHSVKLKHSKQKSTLDSATA
jgi:DNA-binding phage protein